MEIISKRLDELKPYADNPRKNDGAVDALAESIKEFGFLVPVVIDAEHQGRWHLNTGSTALQMGRMFYAFGSICENTICSR